MSRIEIYGCSDDLVEAEGDLTEEFDAWRTGWTGRVLNEAGDGIRVALKFDPYGGNADDGKLS